MARAEFRKILKDMVEGVRGGYAGTIMEKDGITVEDYVKEGFAFDIETLGVEYGKVLDEIRRASKVLNLGPVEEILISSGSNNIILRYATPDYFLVFALSGRTLLGRARHLLKKAARSAKEELLK